MKEAHACKKIFADALQLSIRDRGGFLERACSGDDALRGQVEGLLAAHDSAGAFLEPGTAATATEEVATIRPGIDIGRYHVIEVIGEGGFGTVYRAVQRAPLRREVALKVLKLGMDTRQVIARFEVERQTLALMDHPNVSRVLDAGSTDEGRPYFVMDFTPGEPMTDYCDRCCLSNRDRLELFLQVCDGVQHAHRKGIIHRDLKPSNVLVSLTSGSAQVKVIDFGVARAIDRRLGDHTTFTLQGQIVGTPEYMSPEQTAPGREDIDTRTDVYSLGVMLYQLLTGILPLDPKRATDLGGMQQIIREVEPSRPSSRVSKLGEESAIVARNRGADSRSLLRSLRGDLDWIAMKALEKERSRRYGSVSELAADVERVLADEPVLARPASISYRLRKAVRRHRIGFAAGAAVVLALAAGLVVSSVLYVRAEERTEQLRRSLYFNSIAFARAAYESQNTTEMVEKLNECPVDLRGWEWHYLERLSDGSVATLRAPARVGPAVFSPGGALIATGGYDAAIHLWDVEIGAIVRVLEGHLDNVTSIDISPDGSRLVSGSNDRSVRLWDVESGVLVAEWRGHGGRVKDVAFSPDGTMVASASEDKNIHLWDVATGEVVKKLSGHGSVVRAIVWMPDGRRVVSGSWDRSVRVWDVTTGEVVTTFSHDDRCWCVAVDPTGTLIASADGDGSLWLSDAATGERIRSLEHPPNWPNGLAFSPDGRRLVAASRLAVREWDVESGREGTPRLGHTHNVSSVAFSPDGSALISTDGDGNVKVWDGGVHEEARTIVGHAGGVRRVAAFPDGARVVSAGQDKTIRIWSVRDGRELLEMSGHLASIEALDVSGDGSRIVSGSKDRSVRIWDARTGQQLRVLRGHMGTIAGVAFSRGDELVGSASVDRTVRIWDAETGELIHVIPAGSARDELAFSPDGRQVASTGNGDVQVWDVATGRQRLMLPGAKLGAVEFSPDGRLLACAGQQESIRLWEVHSGELLFVLRGHESGAQGVAFSPDGERLVSTDYAGLIKVWDLTTGRPALTLHSRSFQVPSVAFSPDGTWFATANRDCVQVWAASGRTE